MHGSTRLNVLYEMLVKKGGGLRIATNTGTLSAVPETLPKLARSWSLLLEEVILLF